MDGILLIDKPAGITSAEVVRVIKRRLRCKTGHLGTLDPFASGVLPICLGEGTKIAQFLNTADKQYDGTIRLGASTDTGDPTGHVIASAAVPDLIALDLAALATAFVGTSTQVPPMYSAIKRAGVPLHRLARQGVEVERAPRTIRIEELRLAVVGSGEVGFEVACSKGTYVRVLAQDIAVRIGTVGHLQTLRRTRFGPFKLEDAFALSDVEEGGSVRVMTMREALGHLREIGLPASEARRARQGYVPLLGSIAPGDPNEAAKLVGPDGQLAAVISMAERGWRFVSEYGEASAPAR